MKKYLTTLVALLAATYGHTQINSGSQIVSVDPFTGIGSVNIPIYSGSVGEINVGVALSYNAKGVTVDEMASSVGLGWSLIAGGNITRQVRNVEDEVCLPVCLTPNGTFPYVISMADTIQGILIPGLYTSTYSGDHRYDDSDPDIFTLNLGSRTVQFAFQNNNNTPVYITDPRSELKIELFTKDFVSNTYTNVRNSVQKNIGGDSMINLLSFVVTDERGNKFYFERGDYERKTSEILTNTGKVDVIYYPTLKWNLHKIKTISGDEVTFSYASKYVELLVDREQKWDPYNSSYDLKLTDKDKFWKGWISHISKIEFSNKTEVLFDLDSSSNARCDCQSNYRLKNIIIKSEHSPSYKNNTTYKLYQTYFNSPTSYISAKQLPLPATCASLGSNQFSFPLAYTQYDKDLRIDSQRRKGIRLKLNSIGREGTDGATVETHYSFEYNETALPYRFSASKDYYGYFNGKTATPLNWEHSIDSYINHYLSIPLNPDLTFGADRSYDFDYAQAFVLNKITNGLGGVTNITYTDYTLTNPSCSYGNLSYPPPNGLGCTIDAALEGDDVNDGLVVWKVTSADAFNKEANSTIEYDYKNGKRFFRGGYTWHYENNQLYANKIYTSNFTAAPDFFHGSNHGFDTTIITAKGYADEQISRQKLTFSNIMYYDASNNYVSAINLPTGDLYHFYQADFKKFRIGLPIRTDIIDQHNHILTTQLNHYYFIANPVEVTAKGHAFGPQYPTNPELDNFSHPWEFHLLDYETALQDSATTIRYERVANSNTAKTFVSQYHYQYDENNNIRRVMWSDSKGEIFKKFYGYNYHYANWGGNGQLNALGLQHLISNEVWKVQGNDSVLLSYGVNVPKYDWAGGVFTYPDSYIALLNTPMSSTQANSATYINRNGVIANGIPYIGLNMKKMKQVTKFDETYNVLESVIPDENVYKATVWDMDFQHVVAEVSNAKHEDVAYSSFEGVYQHPSSPYNQGNWNFDVSYIKSKADLAGLTRALTGNFVYRLVMGANDIQSQPLNNRPYLLTFWKFDPNPGSILSVEVTGSSGTTAIAPVLRKTVGQWKFYTAEFTPPAQGVVRVYNHTGALPADVYVDEVRLYPPESGMSTTTYKPLFGIGSTCTADDQVTYFEYDVFGSVKIERDMYGNIRSKTEYVNQEAATNPAAVPQTTY